MELININKIKENYAAPTNKKWKKVADYLLYTLPLLITATIAVPSNDSIKVWLIFGMNVIVIGLKGFTKFTVEPILKK